MKKRLLLISLLLLVGCQTVNSSSQQNIISSSYSDSNQLESLSSENSSISESSSISSLPNLDKQPKTVLYHTSFKNEIPTSYYDSCKGLTGESLKKALHDIIDGHVEFTYSSLNSSDFNVIDVDPNDSNKIYYIYTGLTEKGYSFNKEHVWAKSHGGFGESKPAGSDLHNLRPCNNNLNSTRGNLYFKEGGEVISGYNGNNKKSDNGFEPSDFSKGDVARTIFYMATRYEGDYGSEPNLELTSPSTSLYNDFTKAATGLHGNFDDLYKWATSGQDPVDIYEVHRNNVIYSDYQKNRNPFIDHPEFIEMIYDKNYQGKGALLDNNPHFETCLTNQELIDNFINLLVQIDENDINDRDLIVNAINYYNKFDETTKNEIKDYYQILLNKKQINDTLLSSSNVEDVINKINLIGDVTLDSQEAIVDAEKAYNALTEEEKKLVTNYQTLVDARKKFDQLYQEWEDQYGSLAVECDFTNPQGAPSSFTSATITAGGKQFYFSSCYFMKGEDHLRFGTNKDGISVSSSMKSVIPGVSGSTVSMEFKFLVSDLNTITLNSIGKYSSSITALHLLQKEEGSSTWSYVSSIKEDFTSPRSNSFDISNKKPSYYALVVEGNKPRLKITTLTIK